MLTENSLVARVDRWLNLLAVALAIFGGVILAAISLMTFISIVGRELIPFGLSPIPGDFELVEVGCAVAVFSFLPYCHMHKGHLTVDLLIAPMSDRVFNFTTLLGDLTICGFAILIASRLWLGLGEKMSYGESTMILEMPTWYGYALSVVGAILFAIVSVFMIWKDLALMAKGGRLA